MVGEDLERAIRDVWLNLRPKILSDPHELHRRLARRRSRSLTRPPRAWCIAIRASDRRITPMYWLITPEHALDLNHPAHPYEPIEHEVTIQTDAIQRYCHPVCFSREQTVVRRPDYSRMALRHRHPDDPPQLLGWRWVCPVCKKGVRTIYYPIPVRTLFDGTGALAFIDPVIQLKLCDADLPEAPPATF